mmetsp:Transcript_5038/g.12892  ORF Transcript_5038/g.12892 Transcript_5038/m.12892 type:complete len:428 (+) Transcript_5038:164-1447(+)
MKMEGAIPKRIVLAIIVAVALWSFLSNTASVRKIGVSYFSEQDGAAESAGAVKEQCNVTQIMNLTTTGDDTEKIGNNSPSSCAVLFFGLPRAFKFYVLPSIVENIFIPNIKNNCDYYLHYHAISQEGAGRYGEKGGEVHGEDVILLEDALRQVYARMNATRTGNGIPHISIVNSTEEDFINARNESLHKYLTERDSFGNLKYFPHKKLGWRYPSSLENVVKQWDSIDAVWSLMEENAKRLKRNYTRVAMLRNDVMYVTPIDVYQLPNNERDIDNNHIVIPGWAKYPVNDRMVAGPYDAVKIWATERFGRIDESIRTNPGTGEKRRGMHSEKFLKHTMLPAMQEAGASHGERYVLAEHPNFCFLRSRADDSVRHLDCIQSKSFSKCDLSFEIRRILAASYSTKSNEDFWCREVRKGTAIDCIKVPKIS